MTGAFPLPRSRRRSRYSRRRVAHPHRSWVLAGVLASLVAVVGLSLLFDHQAARLFSGNSAEATVVLEGQAMAHGHLTLSGWTLPLDSFWVIDALFYMVAAWIVGLHNSLFHLVPSVIAALTVVTGAWLARTNATGASALAAAGTVGLVIGLPGPLLSTWLLQGGLHIGTTLWCLIAFLGLRRGRFGVGWAIGVVLLAAGLLGDIQTAIYGVAPVLAAGVAASLRTRRLAAGLPAGAAAVAAGLLYELAHLLVGLVGSFALASTTRYATPAQAVHHLHPAVTDLTLLLAMSNHHAPVTEPHWLQFLRLLIAVVVLVALAASVLSLLVGLVTGSQERQRSYERYRAGPSRREPGLPGWHVEDMLLTAVVADVAVFCLLATPGPTTVTFARYLAPAVIFAAVLAGRWVARVAALGAVPALSSALAAVVAGALVVLGVGFAVTLHRAPRDRLDPPVALAGFLERHQLTRGLGDYWSASVTTVASGGRVVIRPVVADTTTGRLVRYDRQSAASWYDTSGFQFLTIDTAEPYGDVTPQTAKASFGAPARQYRLGSYTVLVYPRPVHLPVGGSQRR